MLMLTSASTSNYTTTNICLHNHHWYYCLIYVNCEFLGTDATHKISIFDWKRKESLAHMQSLQSPGFVHSIWHALCLSKHLSIYHLLTFLALSHINTHFFLALQVNHTHTHTPGLHLLSLRWRHYSYWQVQNWLKVTGWCFLITNLIPLWPN